MNIDAPSKILITGGHEIGGVGSVAAGLADGFAALSIPTEVIRPSKILSRWRDLRDPKVLKILSTTAVFAAPFAKRVICVAHGLPCADVQGWRTMTGVIGSFKLANAAGAQLAAVSDYTAIHLQNLFNVKIDSVIRNPLKPLYLEPLNADAQERCYMTYVGRLHPAKNLHRLLPAMSDVLNERPDLRVCIIGDGPLRSQLEKSVGGNPRVEFKRSPDDIEVRDYLRQTKVFVSGNCTEGLGVTYLEALSQGCIVAMPASGGGLELALEQVGTSIQLLPISLERAAIAASLRRALDAKYNPVSLSAYEPKAVAAAYLNLDARRDLKRRDFVGDRVRMIGEQN